MFNSGLVAIPNRLTKPRGASGTVMRHFLRTRVFAAPAAVAALALGVTVPAASRVLIRSPLRARGRRG